MAAFDLTLDQLVAQALPAGFSVNTEFVNRSLKKWQLLLWEGLGVDEPNRFVYESYSELARVLLANLVVYDMLVVASKEAFFNALGKDVTTGETTPNEKRITTGPTEVEFHSSADELSKLLKNTSGPGGLLEEYMAETCMYAQKLGIKLPFCRAIRHMMPVTSVHTKTLVDPEHILNRNGIHRDE